MPSAGDSFLVQLKPVHLGWGTIGASRVTNPRHQDEAYIPIPAKVARRYSILKGTDFTATSSDGLFNEQVKASGSTSANSPYAKQFQGKGNLKLIGQWLKNQKGAKPGDRVLVEFLSSTEVKFTHIP